MLKHTLDLKFWVRFWEKMWFGLREARRRQNESVWKNCYYLALKTAKLLISRVSFVWSYLRNGHWSTLTVFAGSSYSWASHETLCLNFRVFWNLPSSFSHVGLSHDLLMKMPLKEFFNKNEIDYLDKTINTQNS